MYLVERMFKHLYVKYFRVENHIYKYKVQEIFFEMLSNFYKRKE